MHNIWTAIIHLCFSAAGPDKIEMEDPTEIVETVDQSAQAGNIAQQQLEGVCLTARFQTFAWPVCKQFNWIYNWSAGFCLVALEENQRESLEGFLTYSRDNGGTMTSNLLDTKAIPSFPGSPHVGTKNPATFMYCKWRKAGRGLGTMLWRQYVIQNVHVIVYSHSLRERSCKTKSKVTELPGVWACCWRFGIRLHYYRLLSYIYRAK